MAARIAVAMVAGFCPMGCGQTLYLNVHGYIGCRDKSCPRPEAASEILGDAETEHIMVLDGSTFTIRHPLRERLNDRLMGCKLAADIRAMGGPPVRPGRYRVILRPVSKTRKRRDWGFEALELTPVLEPAEDADTFAGPNGEAIP